LCMLEAAEVGSICWRCCGLLDMLDVLDVLGGDATCPALPHRNFVEYPR